MIGLKNRLVSQGIIKETDNHETIIVSGGQQGIDLASKSLFESGETLLL